MKADRVCVGGIDLDSKKSLRLLGSDENNLAQDNPIRPGELWELQYRPRERTVPPHVEDVVVSRGHRVDAVSDLKTAVLNLVKPWDCDLDQIFEGCLKVTDAGTAYLPADGRIPLCSTGYWTVTSTVRRSQFDDYGIHYWMPDGPSIRSVKYVGMEEDPIDVIPRQALIRFSLARWWAFPMGEGEQRCYLQLSGWCL
jgi:hypothetical protein